MNLGGVKGRLVGEHNQNVFYEILRKLQLICIENAGINCHWLHASFSFSIGDGT